MRRLVDGERLRERQHGTLGGDVGRGVQLADGGHQARDVHDRPARLPEMGERSLAEREGADDVQLEDGAEVVDREHVDRVMRRVPAGVVDQAVESAVPRKRLGEERLTVLVPRHVAADEASRSPARWP